MYARRRSASNVGRGDGAKLGRGDGALERGVGGERRPEAIVVVVVAMSKPVTVDASKRKREETRAGHGCRRPPHPARRVTAEDGRLPDLDVGACLARCSSTWRRLRRIRQQDAHIAALALRVSESVPPPRTELLRPVLGFLVRRPPPNWCQHVLDNLPVRRARPFCVLLFRDGAGLPAILLVRAPKRHVLVSDEPALVSPSTDAAHIHYLQRFSHVWLGYIRLQGGPGGHVAGL